MKKTVFVLLSVVLVFLSCLMCSAQESEETELYDRSRLMHDSERLYEDFSFKSLGGRIANSVKDAFYPSLTIFCGILGMIFICAAINSFGVNFDGYDIGGYISTVCFSAYLFGIIKNLCLSLTEYIVNLRNLSAVLLPAISAASISDGIMTSKNSCTAIALVVLAVEFLVSSVVLPCTKLLFVFMTVSGIVGKGIDVKGISSSLRTFTLFCISFLMTAVITVVHFQSVIARSADSIGTRAVRFASSSFVPVVGNLLGDGIKTVCESLKAVLRITGAAGIAAVISAFLPPFLACMILKIELNICICIAKTLGCTNEALLLSEMGGILNILNAGIIVSTVGFSLVIVTLCSLV